MTKIFSRSVAIETDIVDAFCVLQKGFTDQFVYYDKTQPTRYLGLGRCIALSSLEDVDYIYKHDETSQENSLQNVALNDVTSQENSLQNVVLNDVTSQENSLQNVALTDTLQNSDKNDASQPPVFFSFNRFDAENPAPVDDLMGSFPRLRFMLPEVVFVENDRGRFLQVNSLGPVYEGRVERFVHMCAQAPHRTHASIPYSLEDTPRDTWQTSIDETLAAIEQNRVRKVVLSQRQKLVADHPFSSKDLLVNLIDGEAHGVVIMYRYADVFFCGCTPELLVRKRGNAVESMCLAGTCPTGENEEERLQNAQALMSDSKNRAEHDYVVRFVRSVLDRVCYDVDVPDEPEIMSLAHIQHLYTPVHARALEGVDLWTLAQSLQPTPATSGAPVGEAKMLIRRIEPYGRGLYAGTAGFVDANGDGEFSVALRTGVFDGEIGWLYAGCGIVDSSNADDEYNEISLKLKTILSAFEAPLDQTDSENLTNSKL